MISQLTIQNYGLIERLSIELGKTLNVFTGQTGAGKSILIGAVRFALGERSNTDPLRDPALPCTVELVCELPDELARESGPLKDLLENGDRQLILRRTYAPDGRNKIAANGTALTVSQLKALGDLLVDFHGPNDHQMLLSEDSHVRILDRLGEARMRPLKEDYNACYHRYKEARRGLERIEEGALSRDRDMDLLGHQLKDLERVSLDKARYEETLEREAQLKNREKLFETVRTLVGLFENEEDGIHERLSQAFPLVRSLCAIDKNASHLEEKTALLQQTAEEALSFCRNYLESLEFEPGEARDLAARCDAYHDILRKYGPSIEDAAAFYQKAKERHDFLKNLEHNDRELREELKKAEKAVKECAAQITKERQRTARSLTGSIESELKDLGMEHVRFQCRIGAAEPGPDGADRVVFYLSPNLGEELKPLAEIVSSGEAARVMLALKRSLARVDPVPVLIFDEIDAQIGGRLGTVIGQKLRELSENRQVILITHLPQIAGFAEKHFKVSKTESANRTRVAVEDLDRPARVKEMAQMMSGDKESGISRTHAEEMLAKAAAKK